MQLRVKTLTSGVGGRLLLAIFGIGMFSLIAAASGFLSLSQVGGALTNISEVRMPQALSLLELSRQAERVVRAAPALLVVTTESARAEVSDEISSQAEQLNTLLIQIRDSKTEGEESIETKVALLVERLNANLKSVDELVKKRFSFESIKAARIKQLTRINGVAKRLVVPGLRILDAQIAGWNRDGISTNTTELSEKQTKLATSIVSLIPQQKVGAVIEAVYNGLLEIAAADSVSEIDVMMFPAKRSLKNLIDVTQDLPVRVKKSMEKQLVLFESLVVGPESLDKIRREELGLTTLAENLLAINVQLSSELTEEVNALVQDANADSAEARSQAAAVQFLNTNILIGVVISGFVCSVLILWLYVGRNLIARLTGLSDSMLAIAGGDLRTPLPEPKGSDEISEMAKALVVFRDTAIEVEESNLREIEEARRRLIDAIENTSEGFAFYDAGDKLVICNSRYKELLYPDQNIDVEPGMDFEAIIRQSAESGNISEAEENIDEWVERRIEIHRNPGEPQLQQRADGRWILVSERKTGDNGTVAIYSDITDLKQREQELATKSNALEQLSTQLAKYLSPQIYDSIFSGKQEVKLVSQRKRLTVFFSDIASFTATTEKLESEDLTQLLNHYLTEMSQIALEYGATIDKYIGDAIVIFFGDPETLGIKEDAVACVKMAIAMRKRMAELQHIWVDSGIENPLQCRMGINTGMCTVGNFGSDDRMDYTIIGGGVNLAARLETACPTEEILISFETYAHVKDVVFCEDQGEIEAKGVSRPVATYRVVDLHENLGENDKPIHAKSHHFQLDVDMTSMSLKEQRKVATVLMEAAEQLLKSPKLEETVVSPVEKGKRSKPPLQ